MNEFKLKKPYLTLGQFIKAVNLVSSWGMVKAFLITANITVNKEKVNQRGKKLYKSDLLTINGTNYQIT